MKKNISPNSILTTSNSNIGTIANRTAQNDEFFCNVLGEAYIRNPYKLLAELQTSQPVYKSSLGPWVISGYEYVAAALKNRDLLGSPQGTDLYTNYTNAQSKDNFGTQALSHMQFVDGSEHLRVRKNFTSYFNNEKVKREMQKKIEKIVEQLLDEMSASVSKSEPIDFIRDFASELPSRFLCLLLGLPVKDSMFLARMSSDLVAADDPDFLLTLDQRELTQKASRELSRYLSKAIIQIKNNPGDNLITHLTEKLDDKCFLNLQEYIINLIFFIVAGIKTTSDFLGNTLVALLKFPLQGEMIRSGQLTNLNYLEECFRFDSPIQQTPRFVSTPIIIGKYKIPVGSHLMLMVGAANRDYTVFTSPNELDFERKNLNQHIAFGGGAHHCLGMAIIKIEAHVAIPALLHRFPDIMQIEGANRAIGFTLRGYKSLPINLGRSITC